MAEESTSMGSDPRRDKPVDQNSVESMAGAERLYLSIAADLARAVRRVGGSDADLRRLASPEGRNTVAAMARLAVGPTATVSRVTVDYGRPLPEAILAGGYDWVDPDITVRHFPVLGSGARALELEIVHFGRPVPAAELLAELEDRGLRPALLEELLAFGALHPESEREHPILALGSTWRRGPGLEAAVYLDGRRGRRNLALYWIEGDWPGNWRFAAVRR
jgi:hypothetical protein